MQVRYCDAELQNDGTLGAGGLECRSLRDSVEPDEVRTLLVIKIRKVLDVFLPDHHQVTASGPVVMNDDEGSVILEDDLARLARVVAKQTFHGRMLLRKV